jgi:hypothetical protein
MHLALLLISLTAGQAEVPTESPTPEQVEVLKRFREEFVTLRPGEDPFPAQQKSVARNSQQVGRCGRST